MPDIPAGIPLGRLSLVRGSNMNPDFWIKHLQHTVDTRVINGTWRARARRRYFCRPSDERHHHVQVRRRADVDAERLARGLEFVRQRDVVPEETVSRHLLADDARQHHPGVNADAHL